MAMAAPVSTTAKAKALIIIMTIYVFVVIKLTNTPVITIMITFVSGNMMVTTIAMAKTMK